MKKLIIIAVIFVIIFILAWFLFRRTLQGQLSQVAPTPTINIAVLPSLEAAPLTNKQTAQFLFDVQPAEFPATLPIYGITEKAVNATTVGAIAADFGFTSNPRVLEQSAGQEFLWDQNPNNTVSITSNPPSVAYHNKGNTTGAAPTQDEANLAILSFAKNHNLLTDDISLRFASGGYYKVNGDTVVPTTQGEANVTQSSYQYVVGEYPLMRSVRYKQNISALVGPGGSVQVFSGELPPTLTAQAQVPILSSSQAMIALQNGKGTFISINKNRDSEGDPSFSQVTIRRMYLSYLANPGATQALPVFTFEGVARDGNAASRDAVVTYIVPASLAH